MRALTLIAGIVLGAFIFWLFQGAWPSRYPPRYYYYDQRAPYRAWGPPMAPAYDPYAWNVRRGPPHPCNRPCGY